MSASDLVELCSEMMRIPSVTGDEAAFAQWLEDRYGDLPEGWTLKREGNAVWVASPRRPGHPWLGFFGHTDTVPPVADNPVRVEGDLLYGLGASDMKSGLAIMDRLIRSAVAGELVSAAELLFVYYDAEEGPVAANGLKPLLEAHPEWRELDLAICLEPTDNAIQLGCVGGIHATLTVRGRAAHSARPWQGENAVHKAGPLLTDLRDREPVVVEFGELTFREVMSVTLAEAGTARNVVPGSMKLNLNYRYAPGKDEALARQEIEAFVDGRAEIAWVEQIPSGRVCLDNPVLHHWRSVCDLELEAKQAWTDVAQLSAFGVDALNCGPGHPKWAHQAGEQIEIEALGVGYDLMVKLLETIES